MDEELFDLVRALVSDIVAERYAQIVADGRAGSVPEEAFRRVIGDYPCRPVRLPDEAIAMIGIVPASGDPDVWSLDVPFWTLEEGRSDLMLQLTATKGPNGYKIEIDDVGVL